MKQLFQRFNARINNKLTLLSIIPVALVTAIITWHTIDTRRTEIVQFQQGNAQQLAKSLATIADFAVFSGRQDLLAPLAATANEMESVHSILFLDADRENLLKSASTPISGEMLFTGNYQAINNTLFVVEEPVYLSSLNISDYESLPKDDDFSILLGWVVVVADNSGISTESRQIFITHVLISFIVLLAAIFLTFVLSNHVVSPLRSMTATVRDLERGNYQARITPTTGDELAILANGINHLARALDESQSNLEAKINISTRRLKHALEDLTQKNQELEMARASAEAASTAKGDFLAQMSHELRTPITAIQGFVKLLDSSQLSASDARYCAIIQQASGQLLQLIDDILDITRLQTDSITIESLPFNLADCIQSPLALMSPTAHQKQLELILDIAPNVPLLMLGDSLRIRQIVYNLISNAIKFTPAGYVLLKVRASHPSGNKITLLLQVTDTGIGIPDRQQGRLFEPFSQADNSISRRFGGSGLGLTIVKQLAELMKGTVSLESTTGKGSTFSLRLPLVAQDNAPPKTVKRICVLLYDTHPESRQALENNLSRFVDVIDSCESYTDLEMGMAETQPEVIIYAPLVKQSLAEVETDLHKLRAIYPCKIVVLTPANSTFKEAPAQLNKQFGNLSFQDKPPSICGLDKLFYPEKYSDEEASNMPLNINAHILIAEDNEFTRLLLETFFSRRGCQLTLVINGQQAIDACNNQAFDLVLMDVHMPEVNGITALETIRAHSGINQKTPIIMLTADILQQEENAMFESGASDLVFKPFDDHRLLTTVHKHLNQSLADTPPKVVEESPPDEEHKALFTQEVSRLTQEAQAALDNGDSDLLKNTLHQLLGIAGVYRMTYLERAVQALHKAVKTGDINKVGAAMETLVLEVSSLSEDTDHTV